MCICIAGRSEKRGEERREERREERALLPPHSEAIKASRACSARYRREGELTACGRIGQVVSTCTGLAHLPLRVFMRVLAGFGCREARLCIAPASRLT